MQPGTTQSANNITSAPLPALHRFRDVTQVTSITPKVFGSRLHPHLHPVVMVKVEIVEEKDVTGNSPYASTSSSRTSSSVSLSSVESEGLDESFFERLAALKDIVPPTTRHSISTRINKTASFAKRTSKVIGNIVWVVTTSALLVALPLALALEDEAKLVQQEKEMMEQQQGAQGVSCALLVAHFVYTDTLLDGRPSGLSYARFPTKGPRSARFLSHPAPYRLICLSYFMSLYYWTRLYLLAAILQPPPL